MAELTISASDIEGAIEDYESSFSADTEREEVGTSSMPVTASPT
jgi:F-type H+-transporting ATPase subunit alpha